jgi:hypothetical protein
MHSDSKIVNFGINSNPYNFISSNDQAAIPVSAFGLVQRWPPAEFRVVGLGKALKTLSKFNSIFTTFRINVLRLPWRSSLRLLYGGMVLTRLTLTLILTLPHPLPLSLTLTALPCNPPPAVHAPYGVGRRKGILLRTLLHSVQEGVLQEEQGEARTAK